MKSFNIWVLAEEGAPLRDILVRLCKIRSLSALCNHFWLYHPEGLYEQCAVLFLSPASGMWGKQTHWGLVLPDFCHYDSSAHSPTVRMHLELIRLVDFVIVGLIPPDTSAVLLLPRGTNYSRNLRQLLLYSRDKLSDCSRWETKQRLMGEMWAQGDTKSYISQNTTASFLSPHPSLSG